MKQVIFVRHAKSDWGNEFLKDVDRYLAERGYSDAYFLSEWFNKNHKAPDKIIASTATRALSTALIFARTMDFNMACFQLEKEIYEGSVETLMTIIKEQDDSKNTLMLFGHNPGFTNICNNLSESMYFDNVSTCGVVSLQFDIKSWKDLEEKTGKLHFYQYPKDFKGKD